MKNIISVGLIIPGYTELYCPYSSNQSLLDIEMIIFMSNFDNYSLDSDAPYHENKKNYSENDSFRIKEDTAHWQRELKQALVSGKNVFVLLPRYEDFCVYSKKDTTYKGKTNIVNKFVELYNNYEFLPLNIDLIPVTGASISFSGDSLFASFWENLNSYLVYENYIDSELKRAIFLTKHKEKYVGAVIKVAQGNLILLPVLNFSRNKVKALEVGKKFVTELISIDDEIKKETSSTPPPAWVANEDLSLPQEKTLNNEIKLLETEIEDSKIKKEKLLSKLKEEVEIKNLLFEKGKVLEVAVTNALCMLGYKAEAFDDGITQLDHVIVSPEGNRFIGETEGKDNNPISIDKFRQLESNIQEDLQKDGVNEPATGILFGNGFRLVNPTDREEQFTIKCIHSAKRLGAVLIRTSDLYKAVTHLKINPSEDYARKCRDAIKNSKGIIVEFPLK